jgi:ribosome-binding factor A
MSAHNRPERVAHLLQQRLAELFARGLKDPRLGLVTITGVKISPDLREARVYWTVHGDAEIRKETSKGLSAARGYLRHELTTLGLRVLPDLHFIYDEAIDRGDRIEQLLREVHETDERRAVSRPSEGAEEEQG